MQNIGAAHQQPNRTIDGNVQFTRRDRAVRILEVPLPHGGPNLDLVRIRRRHTLFDKDSESPVEQNEHEDGGQYDPGYLDDLARLDGCGYLERFTTSGAPGEVEHRNHNAVQEDTAGPGYEVEEAVDLRRTLRSRFRKPKRFHHVPSSDLCERARGGARSYRRLQVRPMRLASPVNEQHST